MRESLELLNRSANEIKALRSQNSIMSARLQMFDQVMMLFNVYPSGRDGMASSPDIVYQIERHIERESLQTKVSETSVDLKSN